MPISVHVPKPLLEAVDKKAKLLKISRNQSIAQAFEREMTAAYSWSPELVLSDRHCDRGRGR